MSENKDPLVSIIILSFNGKKYLDGCLSSVLQTKYSNFEIVFIDNGSTDCSTNYVWEKFGSNRRLRIISLVKNIGIGPGFNVGLKNAKGSYIALLNNDTIVDPYWLTYLIDALMEDNTIGLASPLILDYDGSKIQTVGALLSDFLLYQFSIGEGLPCSVEFLPTFEASFTSGAAMIIRRELVNEIGLFDVKVPSYYDDILMAFKTWLAGKRVVTVPRSRVRHKTQGTPGWNKDISTLNWSISRICLILDVYSGFGKLTKALLIFAICETFHLISERALFKIFSYIKAISWLLLNLKHIWKNRIKHWSIAKVTPEMLDSRFIRIRFPYSIYLRKGWSIQCKEEGEKYQNSLILASNTGTANC